VQYARETCRRCGQAFAMPEPPRVAAVAWEPAEPADAKLRLRAFRPALGLTQAQVGLRCGAARSYVSRWENGVVRITLAGVQRLACALNVTLSSFVLETDPSMVVVAAYCRRLTAAQHEEILAAVRKLAVRHAA